MTKAFLCDRCETLHEGGRRGVLKAKAKDPELRQLLRVGESNRYPDLCESCVWELAHWFEEGGR